MILNTIRSLHTRYQTIRPSSIPRSLKIASSFSSSTSSWAGEDERRLCHAVIRVRSVSEQVNYYQKHFGMSVQKSDPGGSTTVGFGNKKFAVKLIEDPSLKEEDLGKGFGHFGLVLQDVYGAVERIKAEGGKVTREAGPVKGGSTVIAFVKDPSGYLWELLQRGDTPEPLCQVMLRVGDLSRSIAWYRDVLGLKLVRERDNPEYKYTLGFMGYGPEDSNAVFELTYNYGTTEYAKGHAYMHTVISTRDIDKTADQIRAAIGGGLITGPAISATSDGSRGLTIEDPDGWKVMLVEEQ